jgi:uncharacterized circularly permuted ATP-grasp superfamily protein/uncharacterized alpha-E superfamily protein
MPAESRLQDYPVTVDAGDLFRHASAGVAEKWHAVANGLLSLSADAGVPFQELITRQAQELGLSFRIAGDAEERSWPMTPMPLMIGTEEWSAVERGLIQRAHLLEAVAADLYGEQKLVREGRLPAAVVAGSRYFARDMIGVKPPGGHYLHVYSVDLARGPLGQWRILSDRLRLANGIGYALENRMALSRTTGPLLSDVQVRRLAGFFADMRDGVARDCQRDSPRIALLTPGRFNQSYPEQAHLARYLGLPLVEGRDLSVSDNKLYVRTIAGPKRIDAAWRWIDTNALDPLRFDARSALGVPDLFDAWAHGGLVMANWPGVEVLEARAFAAFMPRLCTHLLGEDPILPNIATWWCGQPGEADAVRARLDEMVIAPAFDVPVDGLADLSPVHGASMDDRARVMLMSAMARRPMDYCGQEIVHLSTTPALVGDRFVPRPFTVRAFVARDRNGDWTVMPGGFARLSSSGELLTSLMGEGDMSADVCIVHDQPGQSSYPSAFSGVPPIRRGGGILASQAADNLFWFGRYAERAEMTVRVLISILGSSIEVDAVAVRDPEVRKLLINLLTVWGAISAKQIDQRTAEICRSVLIEEKLSGGIGALLANIRGAGLGLRDRFAPDFWRVASRPLGEVPPSRSGALLRICRDLIERFSAMSGLVAEDMVRGPAWRFLDMGRRTERALSICRAVRQLSRATDQADAMNVVLDLCDSQITYRSRYVTGAMRDPALDLVLLDPDNPRSLIFQLMTITGHIEALPALNEDALPEPTLLAARAILAPLASLSVEALDDDILQQTETRLLALSELVSARYFLHYEKNADRVRADLLA